MPREARFLDLRRVADWLGLSASEASRRGESIERVIRRLGSTCVPLLGRTLRVAGDRGRAVAREGLELVASLDDAARARVVAELKDIAGGAATDDGKLSAIGLLADLGASIRSTGSTGIVRFADPAAVQRRSATALAAQLDTAADLAKAADLMIRELAVADAAHMLHVLADVAPGVAASLAHELRARLDLPDELRDALPAPAVAMPALPRTRPAHALVLVDPASRIVVIATRKHTGARRWRRWAVLIAPTGRIDDCLHEEDARDDAESLVAGLIEDGYRVASRDHDDARDAVAAAAKLSADALTPAYYLGRDLLDLAGEHLATPAPLDRAIELLAAGDPAAASALLAELAPRTISRGDRLLGDDAADIAAATAACLLAQDRAGQALDSLARAIALEPEWPLHHWNLAVALHRTGDLAGCFDALTRFVATSRAPTGLAADPDQPERIACAEHLLGELERTSRLRGIRLRRRAARRPRKR